MSWTRTLDGDPVNPNWEYTLDGDYRPKAVTYSIDGDLQLEGRTVTQKYFDNIRSCMQEDF